MKWWVIAGLSTQHIWVQDTLHWWNKEQDQWCTDTWYHTHKTWMEEGIWEMSKSQQRRKYSTKWPPEVSLLTRVVTHCGNIIQDCNLPVRPQLPLKRLIMNEQAGDLQSSLVMSGWILKRECSRCITLQTGQCWEEFEDIDQKLRAKVTDCGRPKGNGAKVVQELWR